MSRAPDTLQPADTWRDQAACRTGDPELFFPVGGTDSFLPQIREAKTICHTRCPVMEICLAWAIETRVTDGIWGGLTADELRPMRCRRAHQKAKAATQ